MYTLFYNGCVHTLDEELPLCSAILVLKDSIVYCGNEVDINLPTSQIKKVNLMGKHIFPGFIDCHTHIANYALYKERVRLENCSSLKEALSELKAFTTSAEKDSWILGGGWDANLWRDGKPHKNYLDHIWQDQPVALYSKDGHAQWLNSKALQICAFAATDPKGGKIGRGDDGEPNGLVYEKACELVDQKAEKRSYAQLLRCLQKVYPQMHALGITSVHSCESLEIMRFFQQMALNEHLSLRICMHPPAADLPDISAAGFYSGSGNQWLRLGGLKYFVDGSLGSQTAEMFNNYEGLSHSGIEVTTESELTAQILSGARQGMSATVHAIGDKANHKALNALEKATRVKSPVPLRHRIEHAQILNPADLLRFARLNIIASMQPLHIADDVKIAQNYLGNRAVQAYPLNRLLESGCLTVFGSDMPIADPDPLKGILAAMTRKYQLDQQNPTWNSRECITAQQALLAYTKHAAYASYEESIKGTLAPGKLADFFAVGDDLSTADANLLNSLKIEMTVLGGKIVYGV